MSEPESITGACRVMPVPGDAMVTAAEKAREQRESNVPPGTIEKLGKQKQTNERLAADYKRYWKKGSVRLTVGFLDNPERELRDRILSHMNAWNLKANVEFVETNTDPQVRIARFDRKSADPNKDGYWSYLGTDILAAKPHKPTMNLEGFTMQTAPSEFRRVVRHEAGHTLGFVHEHVRAELIDRLDQPRVIEHFMRQEGWTREEVIAQVLTPIDAVSLLGTSTPDPDSIMCYFVEPYLTADFKGIVGGTDITDRDHDFAARIYPK